MQPLGDHLRAHQQIDLARAKVPQNAPVIVLALEYVRIHALDSRVWKQPAQGVLDSLGAQTRVADGGIATLGLRTDPRRGSGVGADMAEQLLLGPMVGEGNAAIGALGHKTA